jgi:hypothetical protein
MVKYTSPPPSDDKVIEKLRWLWENGTVVRTPHFEIELRAAGATMMDVESVLMGNCRVENCRWDANHRRHSDKISGCDEDGDILNVVVSIDLRNSKLILLTAI